MCHKSKYCYSIKIIYNYLHYQDFLQYLLYNNFNFEFLLKNPAFCYNLFHKKYAKLIYFIRFMNYL